MGNTNRGPLRWERAALNAVRRPHTEAAKLYRDRVNMAVMVADTAAMVTDARTPWEHVADMYVWNNKTRTVDFLKERRRYVTCSLYCTMMQLALDKGTTDMERLKSAFDGAHPRVRRLKTKANRRCEVCGKGVTHE